MIIIIILSIISFLPFVYYNCLVLQQQYYEMRRFYTFVKIRLINYILIKIGLLVLLFSEILLYYLFEYGYLIFSLNILSLLYFLKPKIKKLKFTPRIIRLFITNNLIFILILVICYKVSYQHLGLAIALILFLNDYIVNLSKFLNQPIETMIKYRYIKRAKKRLLESKQLRIIGITGSYGKTSTKNILAKMLEKDYYILTTKGSINTPMGLVKTVNEYLDKNHQILIAEMGVDRRGGMDKLLKLFSLDFGVVTAIGSQHLSTFKSLNNITKEKMKLLKSLDEKATGFINLDDPNINSESEFLRSKIVTYSMNCESDFKLIDIDYDCNGSTFKVINMGKKISFRTKLLGQHNIKNILAALSIAITLEVPITRLQQVVASLEPSPHRLEKKFHKNKIILDDGYNSNFQGFIYALDVLSKFKIKKILVTPGLIELGRDWYQNNYTIAKEVIEVADLVILVNAKNTIPFQDCFKEHQYTDYLIVDKTLDAFRVIDGMVEESVILIENDLPDIYI